MQVSDYPGLTPAQEKKIKIAVEGRCELCSEYSALPFLEIHRISRRLYREMARDPSTRILVVCHLCHQHIHALPVLVRNQRAIVSRRSFYTRQDLRRILGYRPKPYEPPDDPDIAGMYEDYFYHFPPGSYRLGG
ncbi:MAG TPA: hypothetical protein VLL74_00305 [Methanoregula sp.]|nr:hypothetical protein [Methanoregula sp.]